MAIKKNDVLRNLSRDKLKQYIFYFTKQYYVAFKENDAAAYDRAIAHLFFIVEEYGDKYVNLDGFICYCLYLNANVELTEDMEKDFRLEPLFKMDLLEDDVEELNHDIKNIFNKERIKERYDAKRTRKETEQP